MNDVSYYYLRDNLLNKKDKKAKDKDKKYSSFSLI